MITAAAVAMTAGAFAAPAVYDYKASVKHMYLKKVSVAERFWDAAVVARLRLVGGSFQVYQKYQKSASLKGYLIMDQDRATSVASGGANPATGYDYGANRGFLVVQNSSAESIVRRPKILPAVLDAKWIDTAFTRQHLATSGLAEGTLFVGGDTITGVRNPVVAPAAGTPGTVAYADYCWTSIYLFGTYNTANMFDPQVIVAGPPTTLADLGNGPFDVFETAWDGNLPADLRIGFADYQPFYHDTWMNGAGIGKWQKRVNRVAEDLCCGLMRPAAVQGNLPELASLSGNLKGGLFLCTDNGIACWDPFYSFFDDFAGGRGGWDDQFVSQRLVGALADVFQFAGDHWQNDKWMDGAVEQETTDVIYGTWSIKLNTTFFNNGGVFARQWGALTPVARTAICNALNPVTPAVNGAENVVGLTDLVGTIYSAAMQLNNRTIFNDGTEIAAAFKANPQTNKEVPLLTPNFAKYYGLANFN